jgi:hypothetical protein
MLQETTPEERRETLLCMLFLSTFVAVGFIAFIYSGLQ